MCRFTDELGQLDGMMPVPTKVLIRDSDLSHLDISI